MATVRNFGVEQSDTWEGLSNRYGVSQDDLRRWNEVGADAALQAGQQMGIPSRYRIKSGDTLSQLALDYGVEEDKLVRVNNIADRNRINAGDEILVPAMDWGPGGSSGQGAGQGMSQGTMRRHTVASGENLTRIAERYGTTVEAITNANQGKITDPNHIEVGWDLAIP